jgi:hypothetical protein
LYNLKIDKIWEREIKTSLAPLCNFNPGWLVPVTEEPCFLKLSVTDESDQLMTDNFYCLSTTNNYQALNKLPEARLSGTVAKKERDGRTKYEITLTNTGQGIAYRIACKVREKISGAEILPALWSGNYVCLLPGETIALEADINTLDLTGQTEVSCQAFNMSEPLVLKQE